MSRYINNCMNEWNVLIEALGQGKQSVLFKKYKSKQDNFLLYPTITYANKKHTLNGFKQKHEEFVKDNLYPTREDKKYEVKYYAEVKDIINIPFIKLINYNYLSIVTTRFIAQELSQNNIYLWLLRVYKLDQPLMLERSPGKLYSHIKDCKIDVENLEPVLSDKEFERIERLIRLAKSGEMVNEYTL